jgi:hypothetical protein
MMSSACFRRVRGKVLVVAVVPLVVVACGVAGCGGAATKPPADADASASSQDRNGGVRERNVVRKKLPKNVKSIALEYTVVLVDDAGNERAVDPAEHTFDVGDSFLVRIRPHDDLYVYVFNEGPEGERTCLLPASDEEPRRVKADTQLSLPDDGGFFTFEPPAGEEKLVVVALPEPTDDIKLLATAVFKGQGGSLGTAAAAEAKKEAEAALATLREKSGATVRTRGPVRKVVERLDGGLGPRGSLSHVEPPIGGASSSYGIAIAGEDAEGPELVLDIPLKSKGTAAAADGK